MADPTCGDNCPPSDWRETAEYLYETIPGVPTPNPSSTITSPSGCAWLAGLRSTDCLTFTVVRAAGRCSSISTSQTLTLVWDSGTSKWKSGDDAADTPEDDFTHDLGIGPVVFWLANGYPTMTIDGVYGVFDGCTSGGGVFAFGDAALCNGSGTACGDNTFSVRIVCACCPDPDWTEAGWYCVEDPEDEEETLCVEINSAPCTGTYTILSGPYDSEEDCDESCGSACGCIGGTVLHALLTNVSGCSGIDGLDITLDDRTGVPGNYRYNYLATAGGASDPGCNNVTSAYYDCATGAFSVIFGADNGNFGPPSILNMTSCSPFQAEGDITLTYSTDETCCSGVVHVVITE